MARSKGRLKWDLTGTMNMGLNYPCACFEGFPGDSFRLDMKALIRFLPQVAPTMANVVATVDTYTVPLRQLCDKIGISWDDLLTGGEDGDINVDIPTITIPESGYESGSLADWLGYPTNYDNVDFDADKPESEDNPKKFIVGAGLKLTAWPVIAYMHIINENYRDQNFIKKLDLTKYQDFIDGKYQFETPAGEPIDYPLCVNGIFPKAWSRDYFGRALPNTQRGPQVKLPIGGSAPLAPEYAPVKTGVSAVYNGPKLYFYSKFGSLFCLESVVVSDVELPGSTLLYTLQPGQFLVNDGVLVPSGGTFPATLISVVQTGLVKLRFYSNCSEPFGYADVPNGDLTSQCTIKGSDGQYADLSGVNTDLANATAASIIAFRLADRMQRFGEILQNAGARAVEYTLAMFGVRIPDARVQRPIFHGSFRMPVVFSEVLQTSSTDTTSPQGNMAGHAITGGVNQPVHIKVIEHSFVISIINVMPRSQFRDFIPAHLLRFNRMDIPVPMMQGIGDQPLKRVQIFPNSKNPQEAFGYIPQYSDLWFIPSVLRGHMKDTFLHWNMARVYKTEPVLSAKWRYEKPTDRSFSVRDEDQMQIQIGFTLLARRPFSRNPQPGIRLI